MFETVKLLVVIKGIAIVSNKKTVLRTFVVIDPTTLNVSVTITFVRFDVPLTLSVFETPVLPRMYNVSRFAGSVTVNAYPGELTV
jgi:hypothetical protein